MGPRRSVNAAKIPSSSPAAPGPIKPEVLKRKIETAFRAAQQVWHFYNTSTPNVVMSEKELSKIPDGMREEIAYNDHEELRITVNMPRLIARLGEEFIFEVFAHEHGHYFFPEDLASYRFLVNAAESVTRDGQKARLMENLFTDLLINNHLMKNPFRTRSFKFPEMYKKVFQKERSPMTDIYSLTMDKLWRLPPARMIFNGQAPVQMERDAEKLADIIRFAAMDKWGDDIREFSRIMMKYIQQTSKEQLEQMMKALQEMAAQEYGPKKPKPGDKEGKEEYEKQLEQKLKSLTAKIKRDKGLKDTPEDEQAAMEKYIEIACMTEEISEQKARLWFYREAADSYALKLPEIISYSGSLVPITPTKWRPSDPVGQLDIAGSVMLNGPRLIPGITTVKWISKRGQHRQVGRDKPPLLLVYDRSESMKDPEATFSQALASSMIAAHSFAQTGKEVGVITFGTDYTQAGPTTDINTLDAELIKWGMRVPGGRGVIRGDEDGGTQLPAQAMADMAQKFKSRPYIIIITDLGLHNREKDVLTEKLKKLLANSCGGTVFLICDESEPTAKRILEKAGFKVNVVNDLSELRDMTLETIDQQIG